MIYFPRIRSALFSCAVLFAPFASFSQIFEWVIPTGGTSNEVVNAISVESSDDIFSAGYFQGSVDFDPGDEEFYLSSSSRSTFVQKVDNLGNLIWAKAVLGPLANAANAVVDDSEGNVIAGGYFQASADFDPGPGTTFLTGAGINDCYVLKLNAAGDFLWAKGFGGTGSELVNGVSVGPEDEITSVGFFQGEVDFDPGAGTYNLTSEGELDLFIQKLDKDGNFLWAKSIGGSELDMANSVVMDNDGNVFVTGFFRNVVDFDPGPGIVNLFGGDESPFVLKLNSDGEFEWAVATQGTGSGRGYALKLDNESNIILTGHFSGLVDFNPGPSVFNLSATIYYDVFVLKIDNSGDFLWAKSFGGETSYDSGRGITIDPLNDIWLTGAFQEIADFDPSDETFNLEANGGRDIFIEHLNGEGEFISANQIGGSSEDYGYAIEAGSNAVYVGGFFSTIVDFDFGVDVIEVSSNGLSDSYLLKLFKCGSDLSITAELACDEYTAPDGTVYTESGLYVDTLINIYGCDSVVILDLTLLTINNTVTQTEALLTANQAGAVYQWVDCNADYEPIPGEIEQSFNVGSDGSYAVIVTVLECTDTSDCYDFLHFSIDENNTESFKVYPNPTKNDLTIEFDQLSETSQLRIYALSGELVFEKELRNGFVFDIPLNVNKGLYLLEIEQKTGEINRIKIVKE